MKVVRLFVIVALVAVACGDAATTTTPPQAVVTTVSAPTPAPGTSAASPTTSAAAPAAATTIPEVTAVTLGDEGSGAAIVTSFDGPPAPDFFMTLENRDSGFQLSDEQKPVYMVFWAEW